MITIIQEMICVDVQEILIPDVDQAEDDEYQKTEKC